MQFVVGEGPCLDAFTSQWPQLCPDLDTATPRRQWWAFSAEVLKLGVHAVFAFPIPGPAGSVGVLELYRRAPGILTAYQLNGAAECAEAIGRVLLAGAPRANSSTDAVDAVLAHVEHAFDRSEMHVATLTVALQLRVSPDEALARLRAHAYSSDTSLTATAEDVVTGRLTLKP